MVLSHQLICDSHCDFTGVCLSTEGGGGLPHCMLGYTHTTTPVGRQPPSQGRHPLCAVHAGIRSTSGRYASHWNAFSLADGINAFQWYNLFQAISTVILSVSDENVCFKGLFIPSASVDAWNVYIDFNCIIHIICQRQC